MCSRFKSSTAQYTHNSTDNFLMIDQINVVPRRKYSYLHLPLWGSSDFQHHYYNIYFPSHSCSVTLTSHLLMQHFTAYKATFKLLAMPNNDGYVNMNLKELKMVFSSLCLRSLAVHRSSKGTKTDTDNPNQSHQIPITWLRCLHARARSHMQVGVFAQGLSLIVHIKI